MICLTAMGRSRLRCPHLSFLQNVLTCLCSPWQNHGGTHNMSTANQAKHEFAMRAPMSFFPMLVWGSCSGCAETTFLGPKQMKESADSHFEMGPAFINQECIHQKPACRDGCFTALLPKRTVNNPYVSLSYFHPGL